VGPRAGIDVLENTKISCRWPDSNAEPFNPKSSPYIDYAVPAPKAKAKTNNSNSTLRRQYKVIFVTEMLHTLHRPMLNKNTMFRRLYPPSSSNGKGKEIGNSGGPVRKS
jgi:hypothetical protein